MREFSAAILAVVCSIAFVYSSTNSVAHGLDSPKFLHGTTDEDSGSDAVLSSDADPGISGPYAKLIVRIAKQYKVDPQLADAVVRIESRYNPKARGRAGEIGLMQIKPGTARLMGYSGSVKDLYKPSVNLKYGMMYLAQAQELGDGSVCGTILKYNAGHGAKRMNPISKRYCNKVISALD